MLAERYKLVLTVLSVNAMIRMIFSCRSDDPLRIHFFPSETLNYIKSNKCSTNSSTVTVLSNREVTILRYLVSGLSNKEIADKLLLSNKTVSAHKSNIYGKLGLHSIVELIDYAKLYELI